jgi:CRP/FNR family transcriptional regulator
MSPAPRPADLKLTGLVSTLRCSQLFSGLPADDLELIAGFVQMVKLEKETMLFHEGEVSRGCYLVQSGAVAVYRVNATGKEQVIHVFRGGESFAEASLASPTGYPANARAVEASAVLLLPKQPLLALIGGRPDLALRMLGSMSQHLRVLVGLVEDLTLKDVETRFLHWLLRRCPDGQDGEVRVPLGTAKRVLASELGTSSETLSRTFARLRAENLLRVDGNVLHVISPAMLQVRFRRLLGES